MIAPLKMVKSIRFILRGKFIKFKINSNYSVTVWFNYYYSWFCFLYYFYFSCVSVRKNIQYKSFTPKSVQLGIIIFTCFGANQSDNNQQRETMGIYIIYIINTIWSILITVAPSHLFCAWAMFAHWKPPSIIKTLVWWSLWMLCIEHKVYLSVKFERNKLWEDCI